MKGKKNFARRKKRAIRLEEKLNLIGEFFKIYESL